MQNFRVRASILTDFSNSLTENGRVKGRKEERKKGSKLVKDSRCIALPKAKGRAKNWNPCLNKMLILLCGKLLILI